MYTYSKKCCKYKKLPKKRVQRGKIMVYGEVVGTRFYEVEEENIKETEKTTHRVYTRAMEFNLGNNVGEGMIATFGN